MFTDLLLKDKALLWGVFNCFPFCGSHQAQLLNKASIRAEIKTKPLMCSEFGHLFIKLNKPDKEKKYMYKVAKK